MSLRRALAKTNPNAYEIVYAQTLISGLYYLQKAQSDLDEAEKILGKYKEIPQVEKLLKFAKGLRMISTTP